MKLNNTTPSFGKTHINASRMNEKQNRITDFLLTKINYCDEYERADRNNVDLFIMPNGKKAINVYCVDVDSQQVIKDNKNKELKYTFNAESTMSAFYKQVGSLLQSLKKINNNEIKRPEVKDNLIVNAITDVAYFRPELYENLPEATDCYIAYYGLDRDDAYKTSADIFVNLYDKTNTNDDF